jgi:hypothetical protein
MRKPSITRNVFAASRAGVGGVLGSLPVTALCGGTMRGSSSAAKTLSTEKARISASTHRELRENAQVKQRIHFARLFAPLVKRLGFTIIKGMPSEDIETEIAHMALY